LDRAKTDEATSTEAALLFFDGECGLCDGFVQFVLRRDTLGRVRFAPLQGETAADTLEEEDRASLDSVVLLVEGVAYRRSSAVVRVLWRLGLVWKLLGWLVWIVPCPLRDLGYRVVANYRRKLFGAAPQCRVPDAKTRERFLD